MDRIARLTGLAATVLAVAALAVSPLHAGPTGPRGPQGSPGDTGKSATVAHLGVCEINGPEWANDLGNYSPISGVTMPLMVTAPVLTDGVPSCPTGTFVSIVPAP